MECEAKCTRAELHRSTQRNHAALLATERMKDRNSCSADGQASYAAAGVNFPSGPPHGVCPDYTLGKGSPEDVADERPIGRGNYRVQQGEPCSAGERGRVQGKHGRRLPQQRRPLHRNNHGTPRGAGAALALPADAGGIAAPPPRLVAAAAPAGRDGFRHSRPLGSYGNRKPGGNGGTEAMGGRARVGPGVAAVEDAGTAPGAATPMNYSLKFEILDRAEEC